MPPSRQRFCGIPRDSRKPAWVAGEKPIGDDENIHLVEFQLFAVKHHGINVARGRQISGARHRTVSTVTKPP